MPQPKISIIIPCYNIEPHLAKCIDSVLNQTYTDFELILIDDGSVDNTLNICKDYQLIDIRIKVFHHTNKGVSYTRNRGIGIAKGDKLMFVDADDWLESDMVEKLVDESEEDTLNICGMINEKNGIESENPFYQTLFPKMREGIKKKDFLLLLEYNQLSSPCCKLYSTSIIVKNKLFFDEDISYQEDLIFNLYYLKFINKISLKPVFGYHYVEHLDSSSNKFHKNFNHVHKLFKLIKLFVNSPYYESVAKIFILFTVLKAISNAMHKNSNYSFMERRKAIRDCLTSDDFRVCLPELLNINVNFILRKLLLMRSSLLVLLYFYSYKKLTFIRRSSEIKYGNI